MKEPPDLELQPSAPTPMRLVIEINWSQNDGGARRVAANVTRLLAQRQEWELCVLTNAPNSLFSGAAVDQRVLRAPPFMPQVLWDQFFFPHLLVPLLLRRLRPQLSLFTNNLMPIWGAGRAIVIMHDLTPFVIPETYYAVHGLYQRWYMRRAARRAAHIITVSEHSKSDILRILGVAETNVSVIRLGADLPKPAPASGPDLPVEWGIDDLPFVLYVGALHPRKNLGRLLAAFVQIKTQLSIPHRLVIVGAARWKRTHALDDALSGPYGDDIIVAGQVDDGTLAHLYRCCDVFVYPSLYEGFGLPVLEAMSMGAPVVTSEGSALAELAGDAALLVDPHDVTSIRDGIAAVISDSALRETLRAKGLERAAEFSWERTAADTMSVIRAQFERPGDSTVAPKEFKSL